MGTNLNYIIFLRAYYRRIPGDFMKIESTGFGF